MANDMGETLQKIDNLSKDRSETTEAKLQARIEKTETKLDGLQSTLLGMREGIDKLLATT